VFDTAEDEHVVSVEHIGEEENGNGGVAVIPGRAKREPGIHNHDREYGFRASAKRRIPE